MNPKTTYGWYNALVFTSIGLCMVSGLGIIAICSYDISQLLQDTKLEYRIEREIRVIENIDKDGYYLNGHQYKLPDSSKYINESDKSSGPIGDVDGANNYKIIMLLCLIAGIILGFTQFVSSIGVIWKCSGVGVRKKVKAWILASTFILLLGSLCLVVPLSYNVKTGRHFNLSGFSGYLREKFKSLFNLREEDDGIYDIFYYVFGSNELLLLVTMLLLGITMPCGTQPYEYVYGD